MVTAFVLIALVLLVVFFLAKSENSTMSWGAVVIGVVLAFLLLATPVGPPLQEFMNWLGNGSQELVADAWDDLTT